MTSTSPPTAQPAPETRPSSVAPRVAFFTPLSPVESGISFYSEDLLPVLARALDLDVFVDGYQPAKAAELAMVRLRDAREFERAARERPYDATIYQLGNSPAHAYLYARALRQPGVVVLHDVVLHHLQLWLAVHRGRRREYANTLERLYGERGREVARLVLRGQTPPALFDFPMVEPVLQAARAVIVHNAASAARVRALHPTARVQVVPMGVPLPTLPPRAVARARLGIAPDAFLVVSLGHVTPHKRLDVALRAFRRLLATEPTARFLIAGSEATGLRPSLARQIAYLGLAGPVQRLGFVSPELVDDLLAAADCCVNLRYPSAGETSASLLRMMGGGLPVLVNDTGSFRELPESACLKVPVGRIEEALLAEYLLELARDESLRAAIGHHARAFVAEEHSLDRAASGYLAVLSDLLDRQLDLPESSIPSAAEPAPPLPPPILGEEASLAGPDHPSPPTLGGAGRAAPPLDDVATALVELRLAQHEPTTRSVARDLVALGLGVSATAGDEAVPARRPSRRRALWRRRGD